MADAAVIINKNKGNRMFGNYNSELMNKWRKEAEDYLGFELRIPEYANVVSRCRRTSSSCLGRFQLVLRQSEQADLRFEEP